MTENGDSHHGNGDSHHEHNGNGHLNGEKDAHKTAAAGNGENGKYEFTKPTGNQDTKASEDVDDKVTEFESSQSLSVLNKLVQKRVSVDIEFKDLTYSVTVGRGEKKTEKMILNKMSGKLYNSRMVAIMGPTGSGKTTLLNILAGRNSTKGTVEGSITVNGQPRDYSVFQRISALVMQDELMFSALTVKETLEFAAMMRLPRQISKEDKDKIIGVIIQELGLRKATNTYIGSSRVRGISGGEKKRVAIAIELVSNPSCIFLDEPTSGLDSFQARNVMSILRDLAASGRTVACSIHQPRSSIYRMFDLLILLSEGNVLYNGIASPAYSLKYFTEAPLNLSCPSHFNPADWFLDVVSVDPRSQESEEACLERVKLMCETYKEREHNLREDVQKFSMEDSTSSKSFEKMASKSFSPSHDPHKLEEDTHGVKADHSAEPEKKKRDNVTTDLSTIKAADSYGATWFTQFYYMFVRATRQNLRDLLPFIIGLVISVIFGLLLAGIFANLGDDQSSIQDRQGLLFFVVVNQVFGSIFGVINTFPMEKAIIDRERASKTYRVSAYYMSRYLADTPFRLIPPIVLGSIVYYIAGLEPAAEKFFIFLAIVLLATHASLALGLMVSAIAPSAPAATGFAQIFTIIFLLLGGFYINVDNVPDGAAWIQYISHVRYSFNGLIINEFDDLTFKCDGDDNGDESGCITDGDDVIENLSFDELTIYQCVIGLVVFAYVNHLLAYIFLRLTGPKFKRL